MTSNCWKRFGPLPSSSSSSEDSTARMACDDRGEGGVPALKYCLEMSKRQCTRSQGYFVSLIRNALDDILEQSREL